MLNKEKQMKAREMHDLIGRLMAAAEDGKRLLHHKHQKNKREKLLAEAAELHEYLIDYWMDEERAEIGSKIRKCARKTCHSGELEDLHVCPNCGKEDPGFIDAEFPECPVECEYCGEKTELKEWAAAGG